MITSSKKINLFVPFLFVILLLALLPTIYVLHRQSQDTRQHAASSIWIPGLVTSWQWQLTGNVDTSLNVQMYDIDGFDNTATTVAALHAKGIHVVCYFSAGSSEDWRPDYASFPASVKGKSLDGWPGENWLDVRNLTVLGPIMQARMDMCKSKGFDAIEPDNIDGYSNATGFPLTAADQLTYNKYLADQAHARGMSIALKNDNDQGKDLLPYFDFALNEECFTYKECDYLSDFVHAGKAAFEVEYNLATTKFCPQANSLNINALKKDLDLTTTRTACREDNGTVTPSPIQTTPQPTPTKAPTPTLKPTSTLPSPTATPKPTLIATPTPHPTNSPAPTSIQPTPTRVPTPTFIPTSTPMPNNTLLNLSLTLHALGVGGDNANPDGGGGNPNPLHKQRSVTVAVYTTSNVLVVRKSGTVQFTSGVFQGIIDLGSIPTGNYYLIIQTAHYLLGRTPNVVNLTGSNTTTLTPLPLIAGDIDGNNRLSISDYQILSDCYSDFTAPDPAVCSPDQKLAADINDDGKVDYIDLNYFIRELSVQTGDFINP
jgi:hypothetical protein